MTIQQAKIHGKEALAGFSPSPELDAEVLLGRLLGKDRTYLLFHREEELPAGQEEAFEDFLARRRTGLPVAYITGHKEFFGYDFLVTPDVLIPKPDTELLVENALRIIREKTAEGKGRVLSVCDMCAGSGCVGLSLLKACEEEGLVPPAYLPELTLADISGSALDVARRNADALLGEGVRFVRSNLFQAVGGSFDLIVANPPYIPAPEVAELLRDGRGEPALALDGDRDCSGGSTGDGDGLGIMRNLVPQAAARLAPQGVLVVEAGEYNAEQTERILRSAGLRDTRIFKDLSGRLRDVQGTK